MNNTDPVFEALDRLARVADSNPVGDPMPGIKRKARANRRRASALAASGALAAVVAAGFAVSAVVDIPQTAQDPGYANSPSAAPSPPPSSPPTTPPTTPLSEPAMVEHEQAQADVDGDGPADTIRVLFPEADADEGLDVSTDVRLQVQLATGDVAELRLGEGLIPTIAGAPDLDGDGAAEVVLSFSGGDAGWLKVFRWDSETVVQVEPDPGAAADVVDDGGLYTDPYVGSSALVDGGLISWIPTGDESAPFEVRVWTWQLDGTLLVATEAEQIQCFGPGQQHPEPC